MTIQQYPQTSTVGRRWAIPAGFVAVAVASVTFIGVSQLRGGDGHISNSDFTRSQVLVQDAIDHALATHGQLDVTRSQVLVQDAIDDALAAGHNRHDFTKAQVLEQEAIDAALASS
jgi:hypothetical protein